MKAHCAICGKVTAGIKKKGAASEKSVSRKFGSMLCSDCLRTAIMEANQVKEKRKHIEDVHMNYRKYVQLLVSTG